jgi:hypothetical protein
MKARFFSGCNMAMLHIGGCKKCQDEIMDTAMKLIAARAGSARSTKKAKSSRKNGRLGGRPRKS